MRLTRMSTRHDGVDDSVFEREKIKEKALKGNCNDSVLENKMGLLKKESQSKDRLRDTLLSFGL